VLNFFICTEEAKLEKKTRLESVSIAEPLQNRQHAQNTNAVNAREKRKEGRRVS